MDKDLLNLKMTIHELRVRIEKLEEHSHPKKDFSLCSKCETVMKEYEGTD